MRIISAKEFLRQRASTPSAETRPEVRSTVERIVSTVRKGGDGALKELTFTLDGVRVENFRVPRPEWERAWKRTPSNVRNALEALAKRIRSYQAKLRPKGIVKIDTAPGVTVTTEWRPLPAVACYAPGGRAAYPSTVLMMAITARAAGVKDVYVASPPQRDGKPHALVLAAAHLADVTAVFSLGGAQAVAAFAYGTDSVPRAPKIVGPGNAYVTEAKRQLFGTIGIDAIAGPTELAIYADGSVDPAWIATDLGAQAEHDPDARCLLVVPDAELARKVEAAAKELAAASPRSAILNRSLLEQSVVVLAADDDEAVRVLDAYAPEHVELLCKKPERIAKRLTSAGTVFLGPYAPASLGDYATGANHVLPTGQSARWASPLSVYDFMR
ncbi:MAG TPA: histidinol dehydrogenase, partial [Candidatus Thermoplasmatota archaeon]|nr:histidinol dehydrogenase [Candidatus Thermoplasmatota archaeon]